jgi:hypothetical protein
METAGRQKDKANCGRTSESSRQWVKAHNKLGWGTGKVP